MAELSFVRVTYWIWNVLTTKLLLNVQTSMTSLWMTMDNLWRSQNGERSSLDTQMRKYWLEIGLEPQNQCSAYLILASVEWFTLWLDTAALFPQRNVVNLNMELLVEFLKCLTPSILACFFYRDTKNCPLREIFACKAQSCVPIHDFLA